MIRSRHPFPFATFANFKFEIPPEIVDEAGGYTSDKLDAKFGYSPVSFLEPSPITLLVSDNNGKYEAEVTLQEYQFETVTYYLTYTKIRDDLTTKKIGECLTGSVVLKTESQTVNCNTEVWRDGQFTNYLLASIGFNVVDELEQPVRGVEIYIDSTTDILKGITGPAEGEFGTDGYASFTHSTGTYTFSARKPWNPGDQGIDYGMQGTLESQNLLALQVYNFEIKLDQDISAPGNMSILLNNGDEITSSPTVNWSISAEDNREVQAYFLSESNTTPAVDDPGWIAIASPAATFSETGTHTFSGSGTKTLYVWFKDNSGNVSTMTSDTILFDTPPSGVSITINNDETSTSSPAVTLNLSANDDFGVTGYFVSETSATPDINDQSWNTITPKESSYSNDVPFSLSSGDGTKTVYTWFKDESGNLSAMSNDSISFVESYASCQEIKVADPSNTNDGLYTIDPDGSGGNAPIEVYCDMTTSGGGWTQIAAISGNYGTHFMLNINDQGLSYNDALIVDQGSYLDYHTPNSSGNNEGFNIAIHSLKIDGGWHVAADAPNGRGCYSNPGVYTFYPNSNYTILEESGYCYSDANYLGFCGDKVIVNMPLNGKIEGISDAESISGECRSDNSITAKFDIFVK